MMILTKPLRIGLVLVFFGGIFFVSAFVFSQDQKQKSGSPRTPVRNRHALPEQDRPGPWDNDVWVYQIGLSGQAKPLTTFERAGVPTLSRLNDGRLIAAFQNFPENDADNFDRIAICFSKDEGVSWTKPTPMVIEKFETGLMRPFDPTLVALPDGRIRMYFTSNRQQEFRRSVPCIYSAISNDGVHYEFEPGVRFAVEGRVVIDCAMVLHHEVFHLIAPDNGTLEEMERHEPKPQTERQRAYHATSKDGLTFDRVEDLVCPIRGRWLGNMLSDEKQIYFFGTGPEPWPIVSLDGMNWQTTKSASRLPGADPGAVKLNDNSWLVAVTSPPRPGTPSDHRRNEGPGKSDPGRTRNSLRQNNPVHSN